MATETMNYKMLVQSSKAARRNGFYVVYDEANENCIGCIDKPWHVSNEYRAKQKTFSTLQLAVRYIVTGE